MANRSGQLATLFAPFVRARLAAARHGV